MADSFTGDTITTTTTQPFKLIVPFSGNTEINNKTTSFIDPNEHIHTNKNVGVEPVYNEPKSKNYDPQAFYKPNPNTAKKHDLKVVEKPTFTVKTLNEAFEDVKDTAFNNKNFFGDLLPEGDLTILFGKSNTGKSQLGYQFAEAVASGKNVLDVTNASIMEHYINGETKNYNLNNTAPAQKIIYADFEATPEKLYRRYYDKKLLKIFKPNENLIVAFPDRLTATDNLLFIEVIEEIMIKTGAKVLEIDNVSAISQENEKSSNAAKLMNKIKDMQRRHNLTILILAHTPKIVKGQPILDIHLAGSSNLYNLAENVFCIGETEQSDDIRYLKQLKSRYSEIHYHKDNVIAMKFKIRDSDGFRGFGFVNYETEDALLQIIDKKTKNDETRDITNRANSFGMSAADIAEELYEKYHPDKDVSLPTYKVAIRKKVQRLRNRGLINVNAPVPEILPEKIEELQKIDPSIEIVPAVDQKAIDKFHEIRPILCPVKHDELPNGKIPAFTQEGLDRYEDIPI